jgi:hypothetical protein
MNLSKLKINNFLAIAIIIDNDFIGCEKTFSFEKFKDSENQPYIALDSGKCDSASLIRLYTEDNFLIAATRLDNSVETWTPLQPKTLEKILNYLIYIEIERISIQFYLKKETLLELKNQNPLPYVELIKQLTTKLKISSLNFNQLIKLNFHEDSINFMMLELINEECAIYQ